MLEFLGELFGWRERKMCPNMASTYDLRILSGKGSQFIESGCFVLLLNTTRRDSKLIPSNYDILK